MVIKKPIQNKTNIPVIMPIIISDQYTNFFIGL